MRQASIVSLVLLWSMMLLAQGVSVRLDGDQVRIAAPQLHFLGAEALQRLHNGIAVGYSIRVGTTSERYGKASNEITYRFVVSYDIFEEKFAVSRIEPNPRTITHLSQTAAETWCLDSIGVSTTRLAADKPFWVVLEYREEESRPGPDPSDSGNSIIGQLIDVFSRTRQRQESRGSLTSGPFRLSDLRKAR